MITLTESAVNKLREIELQNGNIPRIDADIIGGCGMSVSFKFVIDEPRKNDTVIKYNEIQIYIDRFTERNLGEETQIDYTDELGFLVGETFYSSDCAIEISD